MNPSPIYLDNNATTALLPEVREAMLPFLGAWYGNPSSPYAFARPAARVLARAREQVAALAGVEPARVVFTSGGTESNNLALHAAWEARPDRRHLVISAVEHASVLAAAKRWAARGGRVTVIPVTSEGALDVEALRSALCGDTALVSIMAANNETGGCYSVEEMAHQARRAGAWFHTDAVQVAGKGRVPAADFVSLCAHKLHGPKGAGALVVPAGLDSFPQLVGGEQEFGWRAGTENVAALAGFGAAAEAVGADVEPAMARLRALRDRLEQDVVTRLAGSVVIGRDLPRLPNTTLFQFAGVDTEAVLARLDLAGFCCSSGSACAAGAHQVSHVLTALGRVGRGAVVRVSTSRLSQSSDTESLVAALVDGVNQLRQATHG